MLTQASMRRLALALLFASVAHGAGAETITLPAAAPPLATELRYRVQLEVTVSIDGKGTKTSRGDFHNTLKVNARDARGWKVTWSADAAAPADGVYEINDHYRQTLALYGVSSVAAETDGRGALLRVDDGQMRRNLDDTIRRAFGAGSAPAGSVLDTLMRRIEADPTFPLRALVPAIDFVTVMQADRPISTEIGKVESRSEQRSFGDILAPTVSKRTLASVDRAARTATLSWNEEADADSVARSARKFLDSKIADARSRQGTLSPLQMIELTTVWARRDGLARLSLDDGMTLYAEETISWRLGPMRNETKTRVTRE